MKEKYDLKTVMSRFRVEGRMQEAAPYGTGHLHDTFRVKMDAGGPDNTDNGQYILQRINHSAFTRPWELMDNISRITRHIRGKLKNLGFSQQEIRRRVLTVFDTREGKPLHVDGDGNYWRVYELIDNTCTYDIIESPDLLYQVSYKFGEFLAMLKDLPGPPLYEGIPDFHDGPKRLAAFDKALTADSYNRAASAKEAVEFVLSRAAVFDVTPQLLASGKIPVRVTHNDTKVNNVLLDKDSGQGLCVIDLDTAMPGVTAYDFGDLVRTTLSIKDEDEQDLSGVVAEIPRYEIIVDGFLTGAGAGVSTVEKEYLTFGAKLMTLLIGMRFLTDHLAGDVYFKIHRPGHNLDRARRQFKLVQSMIEHEEEMERVVGGW